jgi:hypothetical protein
MSLHLQFAAMTACSVLAISTTALSGCTEATRLAATADSVVVTCGAELDLTEESVWIDWAGVSRPWTVEVSEDQITLRRSGQCGDECNVSEELTLGGLFDECPALVSAQATTHDAGSPAGSSTRVVSATKGTLSIQDWDLLGAGLISGELRSEIELDFYILLEPE